MGMKTAFWNKKYHKRNNVKDLWDNFPVYVIFCRLPWRIKRTSVSPNKPVMRNNCRMVGSKHYVRALTWEPASSTKRSLELESVFQKRVPKTQDFCHTAACQMTSVCRKIEEWESFQYIVTVLLWLFLIFRHVFYNSYKNAATHNSRSQICKPESTPRLEMGLFFVLSCLVFCGFAALRVESQYVFDLYKNQPALQAVEVMRILKDAVPGESYPALTHIPETNFSCDQMQFPGFYSDTDETARCQVFHRCDLNGLQTNYLCPNTTVFSQILLTCDYFFNVDCNR